MGRYATRAEQLDGLLRGERFVDLHRVVRQALRAGVESYSIKQLEQFYGFARAMPLAERRRHLQAIELALEGNAPAAIPDEARAAVEAYNADDCRSTEALRDWLERLRAELVAQGTAVPRPSRKTARRARRSASWRRASRRRARGCSRASAGSRQPGSRAASALAARVSVDWHRREDKAAWWEYFRLRDLPEADLFDEPQAIAGLEYVGAREGGVLRRTASPRARWSTATVIRRRRSRLAAGGELLMPGGKRIGELVAHDRDARTIDIRKGPQKADVHPSAVFECKVVSTTSSRKPCCAVRRNDPGRRQRAARTSSSGARRACAPAAFRPPRSTRTSSSFAVRLATRSDRTTLAIQGPRDPARPTSARR